MTRRALPPYREPGRTGEHVLVSAGAWVLLILLGGVLYLITSP